MMSLQPFEQPFGQLPGESSDRIQGRKIETSSIDIDKLTPTFKDYAEIPTIIKKATTDATVTTIASTPIPSGATRAFEILLLARRTGGSSGSAEDCARYKISAVFKNVSSTAALVGAVTKVADESQAGWDADLTASGQSALLRVTGATNNNITWLARIRTYTLFS